VAAREAAYLQQQQELLDTLPAAAEDLLAWHRGALESARKAFRAQTATLQEALRTKAMETLEETLAGHYDELCRSNEQRADEVLRALLETHFAPVEQAVEEDAYESWGGQQGFQEAKEKAKRAVLAASSSSGGGGGGGAAPALVWERLEKLTSKAAQRLQQRLVHARQQSEAALQARLAQAEAEKRDEVRKLTSELEHANLRAELVQQQQQQAEEARSSLKEQLDRNREEAGQLRDQKRAEEEAHRQELAQVREEAERLRAEAGASERERQQVQREREQERARDRERERAGQVEGEKMRVLEAECQKLREAMLAMEGEGDSEKLALKEECARTWESLQVAERRLEAAQTDLAREKARADNEVEMRERERKEWALENEQKRVSWEEAAHRDREAARERERAEVFERTSSEWQERLRTRELELAREAEEWRLRVSAAEKAREDERQQERARARADAAEQRKLLCRLAEMLGGLDAVVAPAAGAEAEAEAEAEGGEQQGGGGDAWPHILERVKNLRRDLESCQVALMYLCQCVYVCVCGVCV